MPMTPIGTRTFFIVRPFGLVHFSMTFATGSSSFATDFKLPAISFTRLSVSVNLSISAFDKPFFLASLTSLAFSEIIYLEFLNIALAIAKSAIFFLLVDILAITLDASFVLSNIFNTFFSNFINIPFAPWTIDSRSR